MINSIIDLSHHNGAVDFTKVKNAGIAGVIHKATQGAHYVDSAYGSNRTKALAAGILWGAYHFGTGEADGVTQAKHFLQSAAPDAHTLLILDFEPNTQGATMTLEQAHAFVSYVHAQTGRWPGLYSGSLVKDLLGNTVDPVLAHCWLWLAQYGPTAKIQRSWTKWTMWQYTDGTIGPPPHTVDGVGKCDRSKFNGTADELKRFWARDAVPGTALPGSGTVLPNPAPVS